MIVAYSVIMSDVDIAIEERKKNYNKNEKLFQQLIKEQRKCSFRITCTEWNYKSALIYQDIKSDISVNKIWSKIKYKFQCFSVIREKRDFRFECKIFWCTI